MELAELFQRLGIALGLGLLVGLQRERAGSRLAGFRTFPLVTVLGGLCALLGEKSGGWLIGLGLAALALVIVVGNLPLLKTDEEPPGVTTEVAMLVMFLVGASVIAGHAVVSSLLKSAANDYVLKDSRWMAVSSELSMNHGKCSGQFCVAYGT